MATDTVDRQRRVAPPRWFFGTDGRFHLVYELLLANAMTLPATVSAVTVLDADSGVTLAHLAVPSLLEHMSLVMTPDTPSVTLPVAAMGARSNSWAATWLRHAPRGTRSAITDIAR